MRQEPSNKLGAIAAFILAVGSPVCPALGTDQDGDAGSGGVARQIAQPDARFVVETGLGTDTACTFGSGGPLPIAIENEKFPSASTPPGTKRPASPPVEAHPARAGGDRANKAVSAGQGAEGGSGPGQDAKPGSPKPQDEEITRLISDLLSEDPKTAYKAQGRLQAMKTAVVPRLFDELVRADWLLKPVLLEALIYHGLDHARSKMRHGTDAEKIHAALSYEMNWGIDQVNSRDYELMVEILLGTLDTDDEYLRAAVALALTCNDHSPVFFEHLHRIIPALIASCDTDLIIPRGRENPLSLVAHSIAMTLDSLIGDRLAYVEADKEFNEPDAPASGGYVAERRWLAAFVTKNQPQLDKLRAYWTDWWAVHQKLSPAEIGKIIIERNLRLLKAEEARSSPVRMAPWCLERSLNRWTSGPISGPDDWAAWWNENKSTYTGPSYGKR